MKRGISLFLVYLLGLSPLLLTEQQAHALDPAAVVIGSTAIESVISTAKKDIQEVVDQMGSTVGRESFAIRQHLLLILQNLDILANGLIGKTFSEVNDAQQKLFTNLQATIDHWRKTSKITMRDIERTLGFLNDAIGTLPGSKTRPRVLGYSPAGLLASGADEGVRIRIEGSWLGFRDPDLTFGAVSCRRMAKLENQLEFLCPRQAFSFPERISQNSGRLVVFNHRNLIDKLAGFFALSDEHESYAYQLSVFTIPRKFGTLRVGAVYTTMERETVERKQDFHHHNDHCQGRQSHNWNVNATSGWSIDPESVRTSVAFSGSDSRFHGVFEKSAAGFQLRGETINHGQCVRVLGQTISKDARGALGVDVWWTEYRDVAKEHRIDLGGRLLEWDRDIAVDLPGGTIAVTVESVTIDGRTSIVTLGPGRPTSRERWFSVTADMIARKLLIRPESAQVALEL